MSEPEPIQTLYQPGDVVGPFKIEGLLGSGAFADVYLARNVHLDERVALKVVRHVEAEPLEQQGAQMMYRLRHPNVVRVTFGDRIDGRLVLAMDYVDGETLTAALRKSGSLPVPRALEIACAVCEALDYVHSLGVAHLDLKPSNLLIDKSGVVRITDFGIAQWLHGESTAGTRPGGSPAHMAPEQFEGKPTAQSDLWAVGVLLHQVLTGETPFHGSTVEEYRERICTQPPEFGPRFAELPAEVRELIYRCLERDPARRFRSARELGSALAEIATGGSAGECPRCKAPLPPGAELCPECTFSQTRPEAEPQKWLPDRRKGRPGRRRFWIILAVLLGLAAAAYGAYRVWQNLRPGWIARRAVESSVRPGLGLGAKEEIVRSALAQVGGGRPRKELEERIRAIEQARESWRRILQLESSSDGTYEERLQALKSFAALYPDSAEGGEVTARLKTWEEDYRQFSAAEQIEKQPGVKISAALAEWERFLADRKTDFRRGYAESRVQFWQNELTNYEGYAELTVISAVGLPPSDRGLLGRVPPDPYFVLTQSGKVLYRSGVRGKNPAPVWNEKVRVHLRPDLDLILEIRDNRLIGSRLLLWRKLAPLPADGKFRVAEGTIEVDLEILRER